MKKYPCIESTEEIDYADRTIRLWINEDDVKNVYLNNQGITTVILKWLVQETKKTKLFDYARLITFVYDTFKNVNAIQVIEKGEPYRSGVVAYLVDFSEDVHG